MRNNIFRGLVSAVLLVTLAISSFPMIQSYALGGVVMEVNSRADSAQISLSLEGSGSVPRIIVSNNREFNDGISNSGLANLSHAELLASGGIITQQSTATGYMLDSTMTRAEFTKVLAKLGGYLPSTCAGDVFTDVKSTLGDLCGYIEGLAEAGVVPTSSAQFHPADFVTRADMVMWTLLSIGATGSQKSAGYTDISTLGNQVPFINRAYELGCLKSGLYFYPANYSERGEIYRVISCVAGLSHPDSTRPFVRVVDTLSVQNKYVFALQNLLPNQKYFFKTYMCTLTGVCTPDSVIYEFTTAQIVSNTSTGNSIGSGSLYMSGSTATGMVFGSGKTNSIILTLPDRSVTLALPLNNLTITAGGSWNGMIEETRIVSTGTTITLSGNVTQGVARIYSIGNSGASLSLSGQVATLSVMVAGSTGSTVDVYRRGSNDVFYSKIATCMLVNNMCTFTTNHLSLFAFGNPTTSTGSTSTGTTNTGATNTGTTNASNTIISGPGGPGYGLVSGYAGAPYGGIVYTAPRPNPTQSNGIIIIYPQPQQLPTGYTNTIGNALNLFRVDGMKVFLSNLIYRLDESPKIFTRVNIINPVISYIANNGSTRGQKLLMHDRVLVALNRQIKEGNINSGKSLLLILARKEILKSRRNLIFREFLH